MDVLRNGGHAVDAAVAVALCLVVINPTTNDIDEWALILLRETNRKTQGFDMRNISNESFLGAYMVKITVVEISLYEINSEPCIVLFTWLDFFLMVM